MPKRPVPKGQYRPGKGGPKAGDLVIRQRNKHEVHSRTYRDLIRRGMQQNQIQLTDEGLILEIDPAGRARLTWLPGQSQWLLVWPAVSPDPRRLKCPDLEMALLEIIAIQQAARAEQKGE